VPGEQGHRGLILVNASNEEQYARLADLMEPQDRAAFLAHEGGATARRSTSSQPLENCRRPVSYPPYRSSYSQPVPGGPQPTVQTTLYVQSCRAKLARLSPRARQVIAEWSSHFIQFDRPDVLTAAVQDVGGAVAVSEQTASEGPR
jgi:hypothetical protein